MDWWKQQVGACFDSVAVAMPQLQSHLSQLGHSMGEWVGSLGVGAAAGGGADALGQEYELGSRRLRVVRQLGEGGYSFVYLVREVQHSGPNGQPALLTPPAAAGGAFALKRVLCGSEDQLVEAKREVATMRRLRHPCLLPLLDAAVTQQRAPDGTPRAVVLMLFPVFDQGNLFDFVQRQRQQWEREPAAASAPGQQGGRAAARVRHLRDSLHVFLQVCAALHSMHSMDPPLAHRDLKPHNVLLRLRQAPTDGEAAQQQQTQQRDEGQLEQQRGQQAAEQAWQPQWGSDGAAEVPVHEEGAQPDSQRRQQQQQQGGAADATREWWGRRLAAWRQRYEAVLMDFGSTRPAPLHVRNRAEAMAAQEDAERMCTAPYRPPELWDVPSSCTIDERVDVWSLGCLLYFLICGQSPFERTAGEAGGSLLLAVTSGRVTWPDDAACSCPAALRQLVEACLHTDPAGRPAVAEVAVKADAALASLPA